MAQVVIEVDTDDINDWLENYTVTRVEDDGLVNGYLNDVIDAFVGSSVVTVDRVEGKPVLRLVGEYEG